MKIIYTHTDEAPALATASLLPIVQAFAGAADVEIETRDISLAARILAQFPDRIDDPEATHDALTELGEIAKTPAANIIKLPNISASVPQLEAAIAELQAAGFDVPDYIETPTTDEERAIRAAFDVAKGSAVNPVLREGNSDRRAPQAVKAAARQNPHSMGAWSSDSKTRVASMDDGDFRSTEVSTTIASAGDLRIELVGDDGDVTVLRESVPVLDGEVVDAAVMRREALQNFLSAQVRAAADDGVLFSTHLKATMMKVSDPIIFGHVLRAFLPDLWSTHGDTLASVGISPNDGLATLLAEVDAQLDADTAATIKADLAAERARRPDLAMVNSDKDITNLHVPSDVIIDASMPAMIRSSGQMWNKDGEQQDTLAVIPDSSYADLYDVTIEDCKANGAFDPTTMGTVQNVGLMAKKAEEYGSHDKTFEIPHAGTVRVVDGDGGTLLSHEVAEGDIWRMCQTKDEPIQDWVKLAVNRARATGWPAVFWLDETRAHDAELIRKLDQYLPDHDTDGLELPVMNVRDATQYCVDRARAGENTISVTGNVLRDYLTDLFPILELGTSAKMLSIVPLMNGGGLFETGAGGSAPKHVQQFVAENHLRWDSLGEFLALAVSLDFLGEATDNPRARVLGATLDTATEQVLLHNQGPSRKVHEPDNRTSHYWLARHWADALAAQTDDADLADRFAPVAAALAEAEAEITGRIIEVQGQPVDIGGYYHTDPAKVSAAMRPSERLNDIIANV